MSLYGWKGWIHYLKSYSKTYRKNYIFSKQKQKLLLYRSLLKLIKIKCTRSVLQQAKSQQFKFYFTQAAHLDDPQDYDYFLNVMKLIQKNLQSGIYPPFPQKLPSVTSIWRKRRILYHRRYVWNIDKTNQILQPGQDPVRQPFVQPMQQLHAFLSSPKYFKDIQTGKRFMTEYNLLSNKVDNNQ